MKKTLIVSLAAAALLLAGSQASAQVSFGFGPAARMFFENGQKSPSVIYGVQAGFEESKRTSDYFGISAGVELSTFKKDAFFESSGLSEMYVDVPVRLKIYIPFSYDLQMFVFGGPVPSLCIGSHFLNGTDKASRLDKDST